MRTLPTRRVDPGETEGPAPLEVSEVGDGVYIVPNVRGGFAPMVAEFGGFVVAVEQDLEGLEWEAVG